MGYIWGFALLLMPETSYNHELLKDLSAIEAQLLHTQGLDLWGLQHGHSYWIPPPYTLMSTP